MTSVSSIHKQFENLSDEFTNHTHPISNVTSSLLKISNHGAFYDVVHTLYLFLIPLISIFGIIGNLISLKVFLCSSFNKQPSSIYLAALAFSDTFFLLALFFGWLGSLDESFPRLGPICIFSIYISYVTGFLSVWYVVLIVIDRYIVVCHPFRGPRLCSRRRVTVASLIITVFAVLFHTHSFLTTEVTIDNSSGSGCQYRKEFLHFIRISTYIDSALTIFIPFMVILWLNCCLLMTIRKFKKKHSQFGHRKRFSHSPQGSILTKAQIRLTWMLVVVSSVFLVLNLPSHVIRLYILLQDLTSKQAEGNISITVILVQQILQMLYYTNFAINFILYMTSSKMFRRCLKESPRCQRPGKPKPSQV